MSANSLLSRGYQHDVCGIQGGSMRTRHLIALCTLCLCGTLSAGADPLPIYPGATAITRNAWKDTVTYNSSLPNDAKREDVLAFYKDDLKLGEWTPSASIDSRWLYLRSFTRDSRAFGLAVYDGKLVLLDADKASDSTIADWVRTTVLLASPAAAKVGADEISYSEYYNRVERIPYQDTETGLTTEAGLMMMRRLVTERLILKMAQEQGVEPTEEQIADRAAATMKQPGWAQNMGKSGITKVQLKELMRVEQAAYNIQTRGVTVTPEEITKYYNGHIAEFSTPEQVSTAGIFVNSKKEADKAMALLRADVEFGTVARTMSKHPSSKVDGRLAPVSRGNTGIPESVQKVIFSTPAGKYTQPIASGGGGYAIFKILQHIPRKVQKLADVSSALHDRLLLEKGTKKNPDISKDLEKMRDAMDIQVSIERYAADLVTQNPENSTDPADVDPAP
jgi:parvulin-like peptidyl-prolyl isomerase